MTLTLTLTLTLTRTLTLTLTITLTLTLTITLIPILTLVPTLTRYTEDAPVSLGRNVRRNENCVWLADDSLWLPIWKRIAAYMPPSSVPHGGRPVGLNQRWRLYKYGPDDIFRLHTDGSWPGSKANPNLPLTLTSNP